MKSKKISDLWRIRVTTKKNNNVCNYNRGVHLYRTGTTNPIWGTVVNDNMSDAEIVSMVKERIYKYKNTWLVSSLDGDKPLRWESDDRLFFAGSKVDAMIGLNENLFYTYTVDRCVCKDLVKEYEQRIDSCYLSGELEF